MRRTFRRNKSSIAIAGLFLVQLSLAQDPIEGAVPKRNTCNVCLDPNFYVTNLDVEVYTGQAGKVWKCREFEVMAANGEFGSDVCSIVQGYALRDCGCSDGKGSPTPTQPVIDLGAICNICGGEGGSDFDQPTSDALVDTGVGIQGDCQSLYTFALEGAFTSAQCPTVQKKTRGVCGCASVGQTPAPVTAAPTTSSTGTPPSAVPPPPPHPTTASPTNVADTPGPTIVATTTVTPAPSQAATQPPISTSTQEPTPLSTVQAPSTSVPTQLPSESKTGEASNQSPPTASDQPPPTYVVSVSQPSTSPPVLTYEPTEYPTNKPTEIPTKKPTNTPTESPCVENGDPCSVANDCCVGLCESGVCSIEVFALSNPSTNSGSSAVLCIGLIASVILAVSLL